MNRSARFVRRAVRPASRHASLGRVVMAGICAPAAKEQATGGRCPVADQQEKAVGRQGRLASWPVHNLVGHPLSEMLHLLGLDRAASWVHDGTLPVHEKGTGRG